MILKNIVTRLILNKDLSNSELNFLNYIRNSKFLLIHSKFDCLFDCLNSKYNI